MKTIDSHTPELQMLIALFGAMLIHPFYALWVLIRGRKDWVEMKKSATFDASPSDVMQLLDPASRLNRWMLRGDKLECINAEQKRYRLVDPSIPEHPNLVTVLEQHGDTAIAYATRFERDDPMMKIEGSADTYFLEPLAGGKTKLTLTMIVKFKPGLSAISYAFHECLYRSAAKQDLKRLQIELRGAYGEIGLASPG